MGIEMSRLLLILEKASIFSALRLINKEDSRGLSCFFKLLKTDEFGFYFLFFI